MFTDELYTRVLCEPAHKGCGELFIVSGFASSTFANRHVKDLISINPEVKVNLIIGMKINRNDDLALKKLINDHPRNFKAYYFEGRGEVHSKVYCWTKNKTPETCFSGSANYSQEAFLGYQQNQMVHDDPDEAFTYFNELLADSDAVDTTPIKLPKSRAPLAPTSSTDAQPGSVTWLVPGQIAKISLLTNRGAIVPSRSGLNWGQRPELKREPNQAYLALYGDAKDEGFLPERGKTFTLITDDKKSFDMVVQQDNRKAISSTSNNSEIGIYFRQRLGVKLGAPVSRRDLEHYGRTDYTLEKIDEETFFLDFSNTNHPIP